MRALVFPERTSTRCWRKERFAARAFDAQARREDAGFSISSIRRFLDANVEAKE